MGARQRFVVELIPLTDSAELKVGDVAAKLMRAMSSAMAGSQVRLLTKQETAIYRRFLAHPDTAPPDADRLLRAQDVVKLTGVSRSTVWRLETKGQFPSRVQLSDNVVAWRSSEVLAWIVERKSKASRA